MLHFGKQQGAELEGRKPRHPAATGCLCRLRGAAVSTQRGGILLLPASAPASPLARSSGEEFAMSTRTYYRGPDAVVTDQFFVWRTTPTKSFVIRDLRNVGLLRSPSDGLRPYTVHVAGGALVLVGAAWTALGTP